MKKRALQFAIIFLVAGAILTILIGYVERRTIRSYENNLPYVALGETVKSRLIEAQLKISKADAGDAQVNIDNDVTPLLNSSLAILQGAYAGKETELGEFVKLDDDSRAMLKESTLQIEKLISIIKLANENVVLASSPAPVVEPADSTIVEGDSLSVPAAEPTAVPATQAAATPGRFKEAGPVLELTIVSLNRFNSHLKGLVAADKLTLNVYSWSSIAGLCLFFGGMGFVVYKLQGKSDTVVAENEAQLELQQKSVKSLSTFIESISAGNFSVDINLEGDQGLSTSLLTMRDKLRENAENDRRRNWSTSGLAQIGEILRANTKSTEELYDNILRFVVKYTRSNQGGLFLLNDENEAAKKELDLVACYAFERKKYLTKKLTIGEGLVGQCFVEGERIYLVEVPNEYVSITSGLGGANPNALLLVPLKVNENIYGVLELATFSRYEDFEIELVEKLAETIASTISTVRINESTRILLEKTQQQAEEMRAQEEEMRQNMEELEATQEEMRRKEKHIHQMLDAEKQRNEFKEKNRTIALEFSKSEPVAKADWPATIELMTQLVGNQIKVSRVGVWKYDVDKNVASPSKIYSYPRNSFVDATDLTSSRYSSFLAAVANEKILKIKEISADPDTRELAGEYFEMFSTHALLLVPFHANGKVVGFIACEHNEPTDWSDDHLEFIKSCSEVLTITSNTVRMNKLVDDLTQAQATLQTIIDNLPRAVFWKDQDLRIKGCNKKFANVAGFTSHVDMIGKTDYDMPWKQHADAYRADDLAVMTTKKARIDQEERNVNSDGVESWVLTSKVPVSNEDGTVVAVLGMFEDITDRKRKEADYQAKIEELEALKKLVGQKK